MTRIYLLLGVLAVLGTLIGGAYLKGRVDGRVVERTAQFRRIQELNSQLSGVTSMLAQLEQQRLEQMLELEDLTEELRRQANEDSDADRPAFGPDSMRRLNALSGP